VTGAGLSIASVDEKGATLITGESHGAQALFIPQDIRRRCD